MSHDIARCIVHLSQSIHNKDQVKKQQDFVNTCYNNCYILKINKFNDDEYSSLGSIILYLVEGELFIKLQVSCGCHINSSPDRIINLGKSKDIIFQLGNWFVCPSSTEDFTYVVSLGQVLYQSRKDTKKIEKGTRCFHISHYDQTTPIVQMIMNAIILLKGMVVVE